MDVEELKRRLIADPEDRELFRRLLEAARREGTDYMVYLLEEMGFLEIYLEEGAVCFRATSKWPIMEVINYVKQYYGPLTNYIHPTKKKFHSGPQSLVDFSTFFSGKSRAYMHYITWFDLPPSGKGEAIIFRSQEDNEKIFYLVKLDFADNVIKDPVSEKVLGEA